MKKIFVLCAFFFTFSSFGFTSEDTSNANYLADQGVVTKQTVASKYRLDDKILRQEVIGMALKIKGVTLPENYTCKKYFADATKNDWVCRAVELAADNGIISRSNKYANPGKSITRAEALAIVISAGGIQIYHSTDVQNTGTSAGYLFEDANAWQQNIIEQGLARDIISPVIHNGSLFFYPNRPATRVEVFGFAKNTLNIKNNGFKIMSGKLYREDMLILGSIGTINTVSSYESHCYKDENMGKPYYILDSILYADSRYAILKISGGICEGDGGGDILIVDSVNKISKRLSDFKLSMNKEETPQITSIKDGEIFYNIFTGDESGIAQTSIMAGYNQPLKTYEEDGYVFKKSASIKITDFLK